MSAPATSVTCTPPANADSRDVRAVIAANVPSPPDATIQAADGTWQCVWFSTVLTPQQISALQAAVAATTPDPNASWNVQNTLVSKAGAALNANATFLGLASPSNAQVLAQVQALTKECNALIRLLLGQLDSTANT